MMSANSKKSAHLWSWLHANNGLQVHVQDDSKVMREQAIHKHSIYGSCNWLRSIAWKLYRPTATIIAICYYHIPLWVRGSLNGLNFILRRRWTWGNCYHRIEERSVGIWTFYRENKKKHVGSLEANKNLLTITFSVRKSWRRRWLKTRKLRFLRFRGLNKRRFVVSCLALVSRNHFLSLIWP